MDHGKACKVTIASGNSPMGDHSYKGISNRGRLLLGGGETEEVDYKEHIAGLSADDLVAFANSDTGGAILIGVREHSDERGLMKGKIVGCDIGDDSKLLILNKAASCLPPVEVQIIFENTGELPFLRIEIPPGHHRPHCSAAGTYKIREDSRNKAAHPRVLLGLFLERESERFFSRFTGATEELRDEIASLRKELREAREQLGSQSDGQA